MKFNFWCFLTGHDPYVIGFFEPMTILSIDVEKSKITFGEYDSREEICLACGKCLRKIGKDCK